MRHGKPTGTASKLAGIRRTPDIDRYFNRPFHRLRGSLCLGIVVFVVWGIGKGLAWVWDWFAGLWA